MCHCKYCGKYSRNKIALGKHMEKKHRLEKEKELSQWQITKRMAKAAFKEPPPTPRTKPGNKKNAQVACEPAVRGVKNTTEKPAKHVVTPHTSEKRYETSGGSVYIDWKLPKFGVTTPKTRTEDGMLREVGRNQVGVESRVGTKFNANLDGFGDDSTPCTKTTFPVKPSWCST